jgi:tetratricopeptide (TPR) repeat protein
VLRVMVGRLELLTPEREKLAEAAVRDLAAPDPAVRERAFATLRDQGRYVEPILRRVQRTTADAQVRTLCQRLLLTDFVTELRAAVNAAADGTRVADDPLYVRAQLASLLREVGLNDEAKAEAAPVYRALQERPAPPMSQSKARHYLRAYARAMEGLGDDRGAAHWYGQFVRFGSQVKQCTGCHDVEGPRDMAWFRDWWAGRKFAQYTARIGEQNEAIAASEQALAKNPNDTAALLMLAYLYEAKGETENAQGAWKSLTGPAPGQGNR